MAAKLEWKEQHAFGARLMLGGWMLAETYRLGGKRGTAHVFKFSLTDTAVTESQPYESLADCMADCESEVRRLLKEAGVEVMP